MGLRSTAVKGHSRHPGGGWTGDEGPSTQRSHSAAGHRYSRSTGVADATRVVAGSHATTADQRHGCRLRHTWCRAPASRGSIEAARGDRQDERCRHHQLDRRGSGQSDRGAFWRTLARGRDGNGRRQRWGAARIPVRVDGLLLADAPVLDSVRAPALRQSSGAPAFEGRPGRRPRRTSHWRGTASDQHALGADPHRHVQENFRGLPKRLCPSLLTPGC